MSHKPWAVVTGDFQPRSGMGRPNYALAHYIAARGVQTHLVAHSIHPELLKCPSVTPHLVAKPLNSYALGASHIARDGLLVAREIANQGGRVVVNGSNCDFPDVNWVHHVHVTDPSPPGGSALFRAKHWFMRRRWQREEKARIPRARQIITTCRRTATDIQNELGVAPERISVVYLGTDTDAFRPLDSCARVAIREQLNLPNDRPVLAFVGGMSDRRKGFDVLISAVMKMRAGGGFRAMLVAVGKGADVSHWQSVVRRERLDEYVRFIDFVPDIGAFFAAVDASVLPSRYEGYSLVTQESLCCGTPAIVTATAGIAERYPFELSHLLLPDCEDAQDLARRIELVLSDVDKARRDVSPFSEILRAHTWDDMAAQMVRLIDPALADALESVAPAQPRAATPAAAPADFG